MVNHARENRPARSRGQRLFFALWPPDTVLDALVATVDACDALHGAGRRVAPPKWHITLHFLGAAATFRQATIDAGRDAAGRVGCRAFHLVVDRVGGFRGSRVGWLAPAGNSGLDALWSDLGHALDDAGVARKTQETFSPHVTVLRSVRGAIRDADVDPVSWPVEDFVLVHSHDGRYDIIERWPLQPA